LTVFKQRVEKFDGKGFNLNQLIEVEAGKMCQLEISKRVEALEN